MMDATAGTAAAGGAPVADAPRLYRLRRGRMLAGVASGVAAHLGVPVAAVRAAFVVLLAFNGLAVVLYAALWAVVPVAADEEDARPRRDPTAVLPFVALALVVLAARFVIGGMADITTAVGWLVALIAVGAGLIWHQTSGEARRGTPWLGVVLTERDRRSYVLRFVGGGLLIMVGVIGLAAVYAPVGGAGVAAIIYGVIFALLAFAGVVLVAAPLLWRMFGALRSEREARIREQERAEFAAMVHDQVLHTLALIQRSAPTGSDAYRLARAQERTLRGWLYRPTGSPTEKFAAALEQAAAEVEDSYPISVEVVVVGDLPTDERVVALVNAAREALVNAARHAEVATVSLYAEVEPEQASVFVRDRGVGFDPEQINDGRHGVRGSIVGRMARYGGHAEIISEPGAGTEVRLVLPTTTERKDGTA